MSKIAISVETAADLSPELLARYQIETIPFTILLGERTAKDGEVHSQDLFDYVAKEKKLPHTSAINIEEFVAYFQGLLAKGYDSIVHISLSSGISSACQNAAIASKDFDGQVEVIDSRVLSTGIGLLGIYAAELRDAGYPQEKIAEAIKERIPHDQTSFALENVEYLYMGGRCSALARFGVNTLHIKPQIIMDPVNGTMHSGKKFMGKTEVWVMKYVEETLKTYDSFDPKRVFITYSSMEDEVVALVEKRLYEAGFQEVLKTRAGATISTHCGPHCLGILYLNDGPHEI